MSNDVRIRSKGTALSTEVIVNGKSVDMMMHVSFEVSPHQQAEAVITLARVKVDVIAGKTTWQMPVPGHGSLLKDIKRIVFVDLDSDGNPCEATWEP